MKYTEKEKFGIILMFVIIVLSVLWLCFQPPFGQDAGYHLFVDTRTLFGIPHFWNIVTNLPFLLVGGMGCYWALFQADLTVEPGMALGYLFLFSGIALVALGSGYYHFSPSNGSLFWDRLPMSVGFMALLSIVISEHISRTTGKMVLFPLMLAGIASVIYWYLSEMAGEGDLRFYVLVQFLPMLVIPVSLLFFRSRFTLSGAYWWLLLAYAVAKLVEIFDGEIYERIGVISGHSLKHIAAAAGLYILLRSYQKRQFLSGPE